LPESWEGYTVVTDTGKDKRVDGNGDVVLNGPKLLIRSPEWNVRYADAGYPDSDFHTGGVGSGTAGTACRLRRADPAQRARRNSKYVFALPARYNFAISARWEELQSIHGRRARSSQLKTLTNCNKKQGENLPCFYCSYTVVSPRVRFVGSGL
jgi:hypothetical protein